MSVNFSPYSVAFFDDPYPVYARLRDEAPLYRNEELGFYALSRFRDVLEAELDPVTYSSAKGVMVEELPEFYRGRNLLKARVLGHHVGNAVVFFASNQTPTTGATLPVDGGLSEAFPR